MVNWIQENTFVIALLFYVLGTVLMFFSQNYLSEKLKNLATKEDIRIITAEEQKGKLDINASADVLEAISKADMDFEKLSIDMCLDAIQNADKFNSELYLDRQFKIVSGLLEQLNKNILLLPESAQNEIKFFRKTLPHLSGLKKFKWVDNHLSTIFVKWAAIQTLQKRMELYLKSFLNKVIDANSAFNIIQTEKDYDVASSLQKLINLELHPSIVLNLMSLGKSKDKLKEIFPDFNIVQER